MRRLIVAGLIALCAGAASAEPTDLRRSSAGYTYFNRPDASMAVHDAELRNCADNWETGYSITRMAEGDRTTRYVAVSPEAPLEAAAATVIGNAIAAPIQRRILQPRESARRAVNIEHCMVARGWRIVRVDPVEGASLARLPRDQLATALAPLVGANEPGGEILRSWANELGRADLAPYKEPTPQGRSSLSELAADPAAPPPAKAVVAKLVPNIPGGTAYKALRPADLASAPAGSAIVIVTLRGDRSALGASDASWGMFAMERVTEKYDPLLPSGEVLLARLKRGRTSKSEGQEATFIFAVPPGKWRLAGHRGVDPCMGAPSFEVAAGEAVFLGAFDFNATPFAPALDMGPARTALNADPGLSNRLRPAHWVNGSTAYCRGWYLYALEFDGFPFEDGYVWGSRSPR